VAGADGMIRRLAAAVVMLAAAVVLGLFARDTWHWQRAIEDADARAAYGPISPDAWSAQTTLPAGLSRSVLGIGDDLRFRTAAMRALRQVDKHGNEKNQKQRSVLETALGRLVRTDTDPARASLAADYLGVLLYNDPPSPDQAANIYEDPTQTGPSDLLTPEQRAEAQFVSAVRLNPSDDNAARNLELMLHRPQPLDRRSAPHAGGGDNSGNKGSGARPAGHGY
jgi:hypothetical protein